MPGLLLCDREIVEEIKCGRLNITGLNAEEIVFSKNSPVQASSIDLKIGRIFRPPEEVKADKESPPRGHKRVALQPGQTVVVETAETITLSDTLSGFGFPPARLSRNAILMTNPGHIDPGYSGKLTFTLINMGRENVYLEQGKDIASLLLFRFDRAVQADYRRRIGPVLKESDYRDLVEQLSPDFANLTSRMVEVGSNAVVKNLTKFEEKSTASKNSLQEAQRKFDQAERKFDLAQLWIPAFTGLLVALIGLAGAKGLDWLASDKYVTKPAFTALEGKVTKIENEKHVTVPSFTTLEGKVAKIESDLASLRQSAVDGTLDDRLDTIERELSRLSQQAATDRK